MENQGWKTKETGRGVAEGAEGLHLGCGHSLCSLPGLMHLLAGMDLQLLNIPSSIASNVFGVNCCRHAHVPVCMLLINGFK